MLNDELKKLGLKVRKRTVGKPAPQAKISASEWDNELSDDDDTGERLRDPNFTAADLTIADDQPPPNAPVQVNQKGLKVGYNPYESGLLPKKEWKRKRDLKELSRWIETKRKIGKDE